MPIDIGETYRASVHNILKNRKYLSEVEEKGYYTFDEGLHSVKDRITALAIADYYVEGLQEETHIGKSGKSYKSHRVRKFIGEYM